jgi:hypothetical protein
MKRKDPTGLVMIVKKIKKYTMPVNATRPLNLSTTLVPMSDFHDLLWIRFSRMVLYPSPPIPPGRIKL